MIPELRNKFSEDLCERFCAKSRVCATYELLRNEKMLRHLNINSCSEFVEEK